MTIKQLTTYLLMALAVVVTGCSDEAQDNGGLGDPNATTLVARYEGEWKVGNHYAGKGEVGVYSTGFDLSTIPYAAILRMAMPHRNVECDDDNGYVVPYNNIGYSQHAVYMKLGASQWLTKATVDGKTYSAILYMAQPSGQQTAYPNATFSKVSGVYSMVFPLLKVELLDSKGEQCETVDANLQITFTTTTKKK